MKITFLKYNSTTHRATGFEMTPLFANADLNLLFNKKEYKFVGILLYDEIENSQFSSNLDKDFKSLHTSTGPDLMICSFLPPPKSWLEKNYRWYENIIAENSKVDLNLHKYIFEYSKNRSRENFMAIRDIIKEEVANDKINIQNNLMAIFRITVSDLPTLILSDKESEVIRIFNNQTVETLSLLAYNLKAKDYPHSTNIPMTKDIRDKFSNAIEKCSLIYHEDFFEFSDFIQSKKVEFSNVNDNIQVLKDQFPEFNFLRYPERFFWNDSLRDCLNKHKDLIRQYIEGINHLEDHISLPGLDVKKIKNFWRFRVSRSFRALFFKIGEKNVYFFLGHHDYGLSHRHSI